MEPIEGSAIVLIVQKSMYTNREDYLFTSTLERRVRSDKETSKVGAKTSP